MPSPALPCPSAQLLQVPSLAFLPRRYQEELESCCCKAEELGRGIALFQGLSNIAFNCELTRPYLGGDVGMG